MYTRFFGLNEKPFSITPDPRYLFMSERHGEALAHLVYGVTESGGFMQLTGEVGTGKTTLVRTLLQNRMPKNADVAVVLNPQLSTHEFLATICEELGVALPADKHSMKALTDALNEHLLQAHADGRRTILIVDEAQNLAPAVLEQIRLLTNLETAKQKLLQIILIGQPELRELLARNDLRQLAQRITGRYHLEPLTQNESAQYVEHRLRVAGSLGEVFDRSAKKEVFRLSKGVPRLINVICDRALLGAYALESRLVTRQLVRRAAREVSGELPRSPWLVRSVVAAVIVVVATSFSIAQWPLQRDKLPIESMSADVSTPQENPPQDHLTPADDLRTSLTEQLRLAADLTHRDFAMLSLFELWQIDYQRGEHSGCQQAADAGLSCHFQRGSWRGLMRLDRPAILTLVDHEGEVHEVVLLAAHGDVAEISIGGVIVSHPVTSVTDIWFGQSMLLWRPPSGAATALVRGSSGLAVLLLRESLASIDERYLSNDPKSDRFDAGLENIVRRFQSDHRLDIDGLVGEQTQIIINSLLAGDRAPRLGAYQLAQQ
jgi:general secretion pathway protein A